MQIIQLTPAALLLVPLAALDAAAADKPAAGIGPKVQVAAYYFPNWGPVNQSEWRLIKAAKPRFEGHAQPKVPAWGHENECDPVSMGWDSSPRCQADADWKARRGYPFGAVIASNTPGRFRAALARAKELTLQRPPNERIVTINSWNEWGEGSYLEPDSVNGMKYLEAMRDVFGSTLTRTE